MAGESQQPVKGKPMDYLLYAIPAGAKERWQEDLLTCTPDEARIEHVKALAAKDGYHGFRVATYRGEAADFSKVLNRA